MNEKIKELGIKAGFEPWRDEAWNPGDVFDWSSRYDNELEEFAKLIIKDCINVYTAIDNGCTMHGTDDFVQAIITRYTQ